MKKHLLVSLLALSLFQIKAVNYYGLAVGIGLVSAGAIIENSRVNWNTERKTLKDQCFYYGKLAPASFIAIGVTYLISKDKK